MQMNLRMRFTTMIAITKQFKQMLNELFDTRGVNEIPANELVDLLDVRFSELKKLLDDEQIRVEYKLYQTKNSTYFVKRLLQHGVEVNVMTSTFNIRWDNLGGCPCFICSELDRCDIGNPISSVDCPLFLKWLFTEPKEETE